jgi:hypothetical protein
MFCVNLNCNKAFCIKEIGFSLTQHYFIFEIRRLTISIFEIRRLAISFFSLYLSLFVFPVGVLTIVFTNHGRQGGSSGSTLFGAKTIHKG